MSKTESIFDIKIRTFTMGAHNKNNKILFFSYYDKHNYEKMSMGITFNGITITGAD